MASPTHEFEAAAAKVAGYITAAWEMEKSSPASFYGDNPIQTEKAARATIEQFLSYCDDMKIIPLDLNSGACLIYIQRLLTRILSVDMSDPNNRRGGLPEAIGFATRRNESNIIRDRVICRAFDYAKFNTGIAGRTDEETSELVLRGMELSGKITLNDISEESIKKIYQTKRGEL